MSIVKMRKFFASGIFFRGLLLLIAATFVVGAIFQFGGSIFSGRRQAGGDVNVLARVGGDKIMRKDYETVVMNRENYMREMNRGGSVTQTMQLRGDILGGMIENRIRIQAAKKEGIGAGWGDVSRETDKLVQQYVDQLRVAVLGEGQKAGPATDRLLDRRLRDLNPQDSLSRRIDVFRAQYPRDQVYDLLLTQRLDEKIRSGVNLSESDLLDYFTQVRARHILIGTQGRPEAQAKRRAEEVLAKVKAGGDFAALARQYSEDPGSKSNGGLLRPFSKGSMMPEFEKAVFALKPGEVSGLVKTGYGYHIIKVESVKQNLPPDFQANRKQYEDRILTHAREAAAARYYAKATAAVKIEVYDPMLKGLLMEREAQTLMGNPLAFQSKLAQAASQYEIAIRKQPADNPDWMSLIRLAFVRAEQGKKDEAIKILRRVLDGNWAEGPDLRLILGRLYLKKGDKQRALESFLQAAEVGYPDYAIHVQLKQLFPKVGRPDLAKKEAVWLQEYVQRQRELEAKRGTPGRPAPRGPAQRGPAPGGGQ